MATKRESEKSVSETIQSKENMTAKEKSSAQGKQAAAPKVKKKATSTEISTKKKTTPIQKGKKPKEEKRAYSLMGELTITTSPVPPIRSDRKAFTTPEIMVDKLGNMFTKTSLELTIDDKREIGVLVAKDAAYLLKIIRVAPHDR